jgi:hypothetical protein
MVFNGDTLLAERMPAGAQRVMPGDFSGPEPVPIPADFRYLP